MYNLKKIIGLKIVSIKGLQNNKTEPRYILFDDNETFIELEEQDISFHDCSSMARIITIRQNKKTYNYIINNCEDTNTDI